MSIQCHSYILSALGYGVFVTEHVRKSEFLCEYGGQFITRDEADRKKGSEANYLFFFRHQGSQLW